VSSACEEDIYVFAGSFLILKYGIKGGGVVEKETEKDELMRKEINHKKKREPFLKGAARARVIFKQCRELGVKNGHMSRTTLIEDFDWVSLRKGERTKKRSSRGEEKGPSTYWGGGWVRWGVMKVEG